MSNKLIETPEKGENREHQPATVRVVVSYAAAVRPYKAEVAENETVGALKTMALRGFGLSETGNKVFKLFHGGSELTDMSVTVGQAARGHQQLALQLEEVVVQG